MTDIVERLRGEEARMRRLFDVASDFRDKHTGNESAADFNAMRHAISGRDPILEPAAAEIERLREIEKDWQAISDERDAARTGYDCLLGENRELVKLEVENERLRVENIQMRFALGYPMPADLERYVIPANPFKCGICDARAALSGKTEDDRG